MLEQAAAPSPAPDATSAADLPEADALQRAVAILRAWRARDGRLTVKQHAEAHHVRGNSLCMVAAELFPLDMLAEVTRRLSAKHALVYSAIARHGDPVTGWTNPRLCDIAAVTDLPTMSVKRYHRDLVRAGLLTYRRVKMNAGGVYRLGLTGNLFLDHNTPIRPAHLDGISTPDIVLLETQRGRNGFGGDRATRVTARARGEGWRPIKARDCLTVEDVRDMDTPHGKTRASCIIAAKPGWAERKADSESANWSDQYLADFGDPIDKAPETARGRIARLARWRETMVNAGLARDNARERGDDSPTPTKPTGACKTVYVLDHTYVDDMTSRIADSMCNQLLNWSNKVSPRGNGLTMDQSLNSTLLSTFPPVRSEKFQEEVPGASYVKMSEGDSVLGVGVPVVQVVGVHVGEVVGVHVGEVVGVHVGEGVGVHVGEGVGVQLGLGHIAVEVLPVVVSTVHRTVEVVGVQVVNSTSTRYTYHAQPRANGVRSTGRFRTPGEVVPATASQGGAVEGVLPTQRVPTTQRELDPPSHHASAAAPSSPAGPPPTPPGNAPSAPPAPPGGGGRGKGPPDLAAALADARGLSTTAPRAADGRNGLPTPEVLARRKAVDDLRKLQRVAMIRARRRNPKPPFADEIAARERARKMSAAFKAEAAAYEERETTKWRKKLEANPHRLPPMRPGLIIPDPRNGEAWEPYDAEEAAEIARLTEEEAAIDS